MEVETPSSPQNFLRRPRLKAATVHALAQAGDVRGLRSKLVETPALVNAGNPIICQTVLHLAAAGNQLEVAQLILEFPEKADLEARTTYGETPLHLAAKNGALDVLKLLLKYNACIEAKASNGMTPLHLAAWNSMTCTVEALLECQADVNARDNEGKTPLDHLPKNPSSEKLRVVLQERQMLQKSELASKGLKANLGDLEAELNKIVGLHDLKAQLRRWAKGLLLDERRRALGLVVQSRKPPHMVFLGNPGTGKTMVARLLAKLLHMVGMLATEKVVEVQRTDLVGEFVGHTGPKTQKKIKEAEGGILLVDEAYRLMPAGNSTDKDYGVEALEEIMSVMDSGKLVVIFAGYPAPMKRVLDCNDGFSRRVTKYFHFDDFGTTELAQMIHLKMADHSPSNVMYGFKLHPLCTVKALAQLLDSRISVAQRQKMNGGIVWPLLADARDNLDNRLDMDCCDQEALVTITLQDFEAALDRVPPA